MTLVVENITCAKLKRRRLSSLVPDRPVIRGGAPALPGSYREEKNKGDGWKIP